MVLVKCHLISSVNNQHLLIYHNLVDLIHRYPHHLSYLLGCPIIIQRFMFIYFLYSNKQKTSIKIKNNIKN